MIAADWHEIVTTLGTTVRELRRLLGWTEQNLADYAVVSQGLISRLERGKCDAVPLHSVVVVLRTLAAGVAPLDLTLSPGATHLLSFATNGSIARQPADPDLLCLARALGTIPPRHRAPFMAIVRTAAAALGADDPADTED